MYRWFWGQLEGSASRMILRTVQQVSNSKPSTYRHWLQATFASSWGSKKNFISWAVVFFSRIARLLICWSTGSVGTLDVVRRPAGWCCLNSLSLSLPETFRLKSSPLSLASTWACWVGALAGRLFRGAMVWKSVSNSVKVYILKISNHVCRKLLGSVNKCNKSEGEDKHGKGILWHKWGTEHSQGKKKWYCHDRSSSIIIRWRLLRTVAVRQAISLSRRLTPYPCEH